MHSNVLLWVKFGFLWLLMLLSARSYAFFSPLDFLFCLFRFSAIWIICLSLLVYINEFIKRASLVTSWLEFTFLSVFFHQVFHKRIIYWWLIQSTNHGHRTIPNILGLSLNWCFNWNFIRPSTILSAQLLLEDKGTW